MNPAPKLALVHDALPFYAGAERVLEAALEIFPGAPVYTLIYQPRAFEGTLLRQRQVITSFIDRLPLARRFHRSYLPLYPLAIEQFDLRAYDLILSSSYAAAHGVLTHPGQRHVCLMHTPMRYAWHEEHPVIQRGGMLSGPLKILLHYLRLWDTVAAQRVDNLIAVSEWVAQLIWRAYRRPAPVIYPPVDVDRFKPVYPKGDFYLTVSRLEPHKRVDLIIKAFARLGLPLLIAGAGSEGKRLKRMAPSNVKLLGWQSGEAIGKLLGQAKALVHSAEELFGIAMVEAQAAGCPVIAYGQGGAAEIVEHGRTGLLFGEQSVDSLIEAIQTFERGRLRFSVDELRRNAERFRKERFQSELLEFITGGGMAMRYQEMAFSQPTS